MFKVERTALAAALSAVCDVVNRTNTIPVLANVLIDRAGDRLVMVGTNLDIEISTLFDAEIGSDFEAFTVPAHKLQEVAGAMGKGALIAVERVMIGNSFVSVAIKSGRASIKLPVLPAGDFARLKADDLPHVIGTGAMSLRRVLDSTAFAMSNEETRIYLNGIYLDPLDKGLRLVATDGHRLSHHLLPRADLDDDIDGLPGIILPRQTVARLMKILPKEGNVSLRYSEGRIAVTFEEVQVVSKLVDGVFPDYRRLIPSGHQATARLDAALLSEALARVMTVSAEKGRAVAFAFAAQQLQLRARSGEIGEAEDALPVVGACETEIGFNGRYVCDTLDALARSGVGEAEFRLSGEGLPAIIAKPGETENIFILMPMRI
jgi:DNA polymerase-3 subunit beta